MKHLVILRKFVWFNRNMKIGEKWLAWHEYFLALAIFPFLDFKITISHRIGFRSKKQKERET